MRIFIIIIITVLFPVFSFAQNYRLIDLENKYLAPKDSSFYKLPNDVNVIFSIKNLGPDTMFVGDTIKWGHKLEGNFPGDSTLVLTSMLVPQDSLIIKQTLPFEDPPFTDEGGTTIRFFYPPVPYNRSGKNGRKPILTDWDIINYKNNRDTIHYIWFRSSRSSTEWARKESLVVYPTPIRQGQKLTFKGLQAGSSEASIYDLNGKEVFKASKAALVVNQIVIPNLTPGTYFIEVTDNEGVIRIGKLTIL